ncbi:MAG: hypothetical protein ACTSYE_02890 [Alphaproteobacteria bacterium]
MTAVVLNDEQTHQKPGGRHREKQRQPVADFQRCQTSAPQGYERHQSDGYLEYGATIAGLPEL